MVTATASAGMRWGRSLVPASMSPFWIWVDRAVASSLYLTPVPERSASFNIYTVSISKNLSRAATKESRWLPGALTSVLFLIVCLRAAFSVFVTLSYFSVPYYLLNYGEVHVSSGLAALLFSCMPVFILLFSAIFLHEKIYLSQVVGIAIGFGSLYMILRSQGLRLDHAEVLGVAAILSAAVMHALCYVITKKKAVAISVITYNTLPIGVAGLMLFAAGIGLEQPHFAAITARSWWALVYLGLFASVGGFIVYFHLLKRLSPVVLSFVFIIFPVFAVLVGAWYEGLSISNDFALWATILLVGFAMTKLPLEKLLARKLQLESKSGDGC